MKKKIEILAPAGSFESLRAAILMGADAVYVGGSRFGARAFADNFSDKELLEAIDYVHLYGRKIYLTVNTLLKEQELEGEFYEYLLPFYKQGLDAVIIQDIGVLNFVKTNFPGLPIHASTQMTVTNALGAVFLEKQGIERIVTARELQLEEIKEIREKTSLEIESFVHGALCYAYSGQCLYSSLIGGRSGNRGQCAQPCRLPYEVDGTRTKLYLLSLKDICTIDYIPDLVKVGITSFKIEGRMKKPEYVAIVTSMYRKYLDLYLANPEKVFKVTAEDKKILLDIYNRGGSCDGYYNMRNGKEMISIDRPNHKGVPAFRVEKQKGRELIGIAICELNKGDILELKKGENYTLGIGVESGEKISFLTRKHQKFVQNEIISRTRNEKLISDFSEVLQAGQPKEKINGKLILSELKSATLELWYKGISVKIIGEQVQKACTQPMNQKIIEKQMKKTGNTPFRFESIVIDITGEVFMPLQQLNDLRRRGLEALAKKICAPSKREVKIQSKRDIHIELDKNMEEPMLSVLVETQEQWEVVLRFPEIKRIYLDSNLVLQYNNDTIISQIAKLIKTQEIYIAMPHILRSNIKEKLERCYKLISTYKISGVLIRNYESYEFFKERDYKGRIMLDHSLYVFNKSAYSFWKEQGVEGITFPLELNNKELEDLECTHSELVTYGYAPMMVSAQCVKNTLVGCDEKMNCLIIKDRYQKNVTIRNNCEYCYNIVYNTLPTMLLDQAKEIKRLRPRWIRVALTIENREQTEKVIKAFVDTFICQKKRTLEMEFTRGHFKRGVR